MVARMLIECFALVQHHWTAICLVCHLHEDETMVCLAHDFDVCVHGLGGSAVTANPVILTCVQRNMKDRKPKYSKCSHHSLKVHNAARILSVLRVL